jgi:hypothetical protein
MDGALPKIQFAAKVALWLSWATVAWAAISQLLFQSHLRVPAPIVVAALLSGAVALIGGCLAICYLALGARRLRSIALGVVAAAANLGYYWYFVDAIFTNPP